MNIQKILSKTRQAVEKYGMINKGDRIAVGVSGGKDSLVLLTALALMSRFDDYSYSLVAYTVDNGAENSPSFDAVESYCADLGVEYKLIKTEIAKIVFDVRQEENPCSLCSKLRRGALADAALSDGCGVLALGHHMDDVCETYIMNILQAGRAGCFFPVTEYENTGMRVIRPLIYTREHEIASFAKANDLPVISRTCAADGVTEREHVKELLHAEDARHRGVYRRILGALERSGTDTWHE